MFHLQRVPWDLNEAQRCRKPVWTCWKVHCHTAQIKEEPKPSLCLNICHCNFKHSFTVTFAIYTKWDSMSELEPASWNNAHIVCMTSVSTQGCICNAFCIQRNKRYVANPLWVITNLQYLIHMINAVYVLSKSWCMFQMLINIWQLIVFLTSNWLRAEIHTMGTLS